MVMQGRMVFDSDVFTSSKDLQALTPNVYIDKLTIGYEAQETSTTAVTVEGLLDLLNPLEVRKRGSTIVKIRGSDLLALNAFKLGKMPFAIEGTGTAADRSILMGLEAPLNLPPAPGGDYSVIANRTAVTNGDTEQIWMHEAYSNTTLEEGHMHYVEMPGTSAGSTGYGNIVDLPQPGSLEGILFFSTTVPLTTTETSTVQRITLMLDQRRQDEREWHELQADGSAGMRAPLFAQPADLTVLDNYAYWDLSKDPVPPDVDVRVDIFGGVASEAFRVIPIYKVTA